MSSLNAKLSDWWLLSESGLQNHDYYCFDHLVAITEDSDLCYLLR